MPRPSHRLRRVSLHLQPGPAASATAEVGTVAAEPNDGRLRPVELIVDDIGAAVEDPRLVPWVYSQLHRRGLVLFTGQTCDARRFGRFARRLRTDPSISGFASRMYKVNGEPSWIIVPVNYSL